jgi:hypothetical protein
MWQIEFTSDAFQPKEPEEKQVNPGIYGKELAAWLSQALSLRGIVVTDPIGEDWGWLCIHKDGNTNVWIGCSNMMDPDEGHTAQPVDWSIFVETKKRWFRKSSDAPAKRLEAAILAILAEKGITSVQQVEG